MKFCVGVYTVLRMLKFRAQKLWTVNIGCPFAQKGTATDPDLTSVLLTVSTGNPKASTLNRKQ